MGKRIHEPAADPYLLPLDQLDQPIEVSALVFFAIFAVQYTQIAHYGEDFLTAKDTKSTKQNRPNRLVQNFASFALFVVKIGLRLGRAVFSCGQVNWRIWVK
jgi:hypothetical protein